MNYNEKIQIHNFVVLKHKVDKTSFIKVSTVAGDWSVSYREDNIMYLTLDMMDESQHDGLYNVLVGMYGSCNVVDSEFTKELFDALSRFYERLKDRQKPVSEEEDNNALEEGRRMYELKNEMDGHVENDSGDSPTKS